MKKVVFSLVLILALLGFTELTGRLVLRTAGHKPFSDGDSTSRMRELAAQDAPAEAGPESEHFAEVIHPFVGYVIDPTRTTTIAVTDLGFNGRTRQLMTRSPDRLVVAIFGGSFARQLYSTAQEVLARELAGSGKEVVVLNTAMGGYKQPQQFLILGYLLALGAEFDVVINLDGFNEVALPIPDNLPKGVHPLFPKDWYFRVADFQDPAIFPLLARLAEIDARRARWAAFFVRNRLYHSGALSLAWRARDRVLLKDADDARLRIAAARTADRRYVATGPAYEYTDNEALFRYIAGAWKRCSIDMMNLCRAHGTRYIHFLQPNQYVADSKLLSEEEQRTAYNPQNIYRPGVEEGYPHLRSAGRELTAAGVEFHDLTMIFTNETQTLYRDDCCHLNQEGYELVSETIAQAIRRAESP